MQKFVLSEVAEIALVAARLVQFQQPLRTRVILILNFTRPHVITYTNNIHEKIYPFWLVNSSAFFFQTVQKIVNSVQKEVTTEVFWLVNHQRNSQMANQIFCFQIKHTPWIVQLMAQFFPDWVIRVRFFCLTISKFFHVYY